MNGWIKLHRKIWENPVVTKDTDYLAVWIWLLTHATHLPVKTLWGGEKIVLYSGQVITGRKKISVETGVEESKVVRILNHFKSEQQIEQQSNRQGSLISILQWDKYQINEQQNEQRVNNERTTNEQQMNNKMSNKVNNVDNSTNKVKSKIIRTAKRQSEQQSEQ